MLRITFIIVGNGIVNVSSNPGWCCLYFILCFYAIRKGMNLSSQLWVNSWIDWVLGIATSLVIEKLWIQTNSTTLKNWPYVKYCLCKRVGLIHMQLEVSLCQSKVSKSFFQLVCISSKWVIGMICGLFFFFVLFWFFYKLGGTIPSFIYNLSVFCT